MSTQSKQWLIRSMALAAFALAALASVTMAVTIDLVPVGNPGNPGQLSGGPPRGNAPEVIVGGVDYEYWIGKYEITNAQWREFLSAKASVGDPHGLYNPKMAEEYGGIDRDGSGTADDPWIYTAKGGDSNWDNRPVNFVSVWDAARFCNWLHNGQSDGDTESGAYVGVGVESQFARQPGARFFLPTEDEWYKAAYHKNDGPTGNYWSYPTATTSTPSNDLVEPDPWNNANFRQTDFTIGAPYYTTEVGEFENSASAYGTFDQGGNVWEWHETNIFFAPRGIRGGGWYSNSDYMTAWYRYFHDPSAEIADIGFRVASVPEPASLGLIVCGVLSVLSWRRRRDW